jgi:uncharacterized membrane protein required for colicin V production
MPDIRMFGLTRGYLYCFVASLIIAMLFAFKYAKYLTNYHDEQDLNRSIAYFFLSFFTLIIPSLLLARWYYKLKAKDSKNSGGC